MILGIIWKGPRAAFSKKTRDVRPAILEDASLGKHDFLHLESGVRLHYVAKGDEGLPLMLFLHGFPEFWFSWRHQIRKFAGKYRTVAIDMRGYGESDKPSGVGEYATKKLAEDINQTIKALGYEKCILVAHDWGGAVAVAVAATYPEKVERLILMNIPHTSAFAKCFRSSLKQFFMSWYIFLFQLPILSEFLLSSFDYESFDFFKEKPKGATMQACNDEEVEAYKYNASRQGCLTGMLNYYRAAMRYKPYEPVRTAPLPMKSLMIWGTQDTALSTQLAAMSAQYMTHLTIHYVPTANHWVQLVEPDIVNAHMQEFLSES